MTKHSERSNNKRLLKLSQEVSRIVTELARLSASGEPTSGEPEGLPLADVSPAAVESAIRARKLRVRFVAPELVIEPAWDILLELWRAELKQIPITVSQLAAASGAPSTTAHRWIDALIERGLCIHEIDEAAGRDHVVLSPSGRVAMRGYFNELGRGANIRW